MLSQIELCYKVGYMCVVGAQSQNSGRLGELHVLQNLPDHYFFKDNASAKVMEYTHTFPIAPYPSF
jgi:hypothetical protein